MLIGDSKIVSFNCCSYCGATLTAFGDDISKENNSNSFLQEGIEPSLTVYTIICDSVSQPIYADGFINHYEASVIKKKGIIVSTNKDRMLSLA